MLNFQTYYIEYYARYLEEYEAALATASARGVGGVGVGGVMGEMAPVSVEEAPPQSDREGVFLGAGGEDFSSNGTGSFCAIM